MFQLGIFRYRCIFKSNKLQSKYIFFSNLKQLENIYITNNFLVKSNKSVSCGATSTMLLIIFHSSWDIIVVLVFIQELF